jgi:hypothetical protein
MKAYLSGGPANGRVIEHPYLHLYRHPLPKPFDSLTIQDTLQESFDPSIAELNYRVADYQFTGQATVNMNGEIGYMIYKFTGMES